MITNNDNVTLKIGTQAQVDSERELDAGKVVGQILIGSDTGNMYLNTSDSQTIQLGGAQGVNFTTDETLTLENGKLGVNTAKAPQKDNTLPITSAAVYTEIGNINVLLSSI